MVVFMTMAAFRMVRIAVSCWVQAVASCNVLQQRLQPGRAAAEGCHCRTAALSRHHLPHDVLPAGGQTGYMHIQHVI